MMHFLDVEQSFQEMMGELRLPASPRWRMTRIGTFLRLLDVARPETTSYLMEIVPLLAELAVTVDPVGLSPYVVERLVADLDEVYAAHPVLAEAVTHTDVEAALRRAAATQYAYAGDPASATAVLLEADIPDRTTPWMRVSSSDPLERLATYRTEAPALTPEAADALATIEATWRDRLNAAPNSTFVPIVEHVGANASAARGIGGLRRLRIDVHGRRREEDMLMTNVGVLPATSTRPLSLETPVASARHLLHVTHPALEERWYAGSLHFDAPYALHEGRSAHLAIAALFYGAVLQAEHQREQVTLAPDVALTGDLDVDGTVLPVDGGGLVKKVEAAFFSWVRCLVVPADQLSAARETVDRLQAAYPQGNLDLVGIRHLEDLFDDPRLTLRTTTGRIRHVAHSSWRHRYAVGAAATIVLLLTIIGLLLVTSMGPQTTPPASLLNHSSASLSAESSPLEEAPGPFLHVVPSPTTCMGLGDLDHGACVSSDKQIGMIPPGGTISNRAEP